MRAGCAYAHSSNARWEACAKMDNAGEVRRSCSAPTHNAQLFVIVTAASPISAEMPIKKGSRIFVHSRLVPLRWNKAKTRGRDFPRQQPKNNHFPPENVLFLPFCFPRTFSRHRLFLLILYVDLLWFTKWSISFHGPKPVFPFVFPCFDFGKCMQLGSQFQRRDICTQWKWKSR